LETARKTDLNLAESSLRDSSDGPNGHDDMRISEIENLEARIKAVTYRNQALELSDVRHKEAFHKLEIELKRLNTELDIVKNDLKDALKNRDSSASAILGDNYALRATNAILRRRISQTASSIGQKAPPKKLKRAIGISGSDNSTAQIERLQQSGLLDELYYFSRYPDLDPNEVDAAQHYFYFGAKEGRNPHPLFDTEYYISQEPSLSSGAENPLLHYVEKGHSVHNPNRFFNTRHYLKYSIAAGANPLIDYMKVGARQGINPSPFFHTKHYLKSNPDVQQSGINPLVHYLLTGCYEGRSPHPLFNTNYYLNETVTELLAPFPLDSVGTEFDALELLYTHSYFISLEEHAHPFLHFLEHGATTLKDPHPLFSTIYYCKKYPDVTGLRVPPFVHYLNHGWKELRQPHALFDPLFYMQRVPELVKGKDDPLTHFAMFGKTKGTDPSEHFDSRYYLSRYPEAKNEDIDPLSHYILKGSKLGFSPNEDFDPVFYRSKYDDIRTAGLEALTHYVRYGAIEKRARNQLEYEILHPINKKLADLPITDSKIEFPIISAPEVSVIIPVYGQLEFTKKCLAALAKHETKYAFEVIVVDDASPDDSATVLAGIAGLRLVQAETNGGFILSCNLGASEARGKYLVFLNNDTEVCNGWLDELIDTFTVHESTGLVGSKLVYPNGRLQEAGGIIYSSGAAANFGRNDDATKPEYNYVRSVDYCSGASIAIPKKLFYEVGQFDTQYCPAYAEDVDLAFKVRAQGLNVLYQPLSKVIHYEGISSGTDTASGVKAYQVSNLKKIYENWHDEIQEHPAKGSKPFHERARDVRARLLVVDSYTPKPDQDAGSAMTFEWLQNFKSWGYHCTYYPAHAPKPEPKYTEDLQRAGIKSLNTPHVKSLEDFLKVEGDTFDVVLIFRITVFNSQIEAIKKYCPSAKIIFHTIDLHHLRNLREAEVTNDANLFFKAEAVKKQELEAIQLSDRTILVSSAEEEIIRRDELPNARLSVIPLSCSISKTAKSFSERKDIAFVGGFLHPPNVDAVLYFVKEIFPLVKRTLPDCRFFVIGGNAPEPLQKLANCDVVLTGKVADLSRYFDNCRISVAPLRAGAGMKGKVLTSLAHGLPCVATTVAAEGIGLIHGKDILVASNPLEFAEEIVKIYTNEELWNTISNNGRELVRNFYSPLRIKDDMAHLLAELGLPCGEDLLSGRQIRTRS